MLSSGSLVRGSTSQEGEEVTYQDPKRKKGESRDDFFCRRQEENWQAVPKLTCCEAALTHPIALFLTYDDHIEDKTEEPTPKWTSQLWEKASGPAIQRLGQDWYRHAPEIKFCPYCGTPAPKMQKKAELPRPIQVVQGGRCDTCGDRLHSCICWPSESAFEPHTETEVVTTQKDP